MLFSEKRLRNHKKILLHFLIHIDVLMLCRKFELIPSSSTYKKPKFDYTSTMYMYIHTQDYTGIIMYIHYKQ